MRRIRICLGLFIAGLVLSGVTAFPLETELGIVQRTLAGLHVPPESALFAWLDRVHQALITTNRVYPFLAYGTDWLAFAHLIIAVGFLGPWIDPVRNKWVLTWGLIACVGVMPLAFIAGGIRGIPLYWRFLDCSFGVIGAVPLALCRYYVAQLEYKGAWDNRV